MDSIVRINTLKLIHIILTAGEKNTIFMEKVLPTGHSLVFFCLPQGKIKLTTEVILFVILERGALKLQ